MKRFLLCLMLIMQGVFTFAQIGVYNGKPTYQIEAKRLGNTIGNIVVEMYPMVAPMHVRNFDSLVSIHFYDTTAFHRVIPGFVIQGGDPNSRHGPRATWGYGQPGQQTVPAEFNSISHVRGVLSAARSTDINSATSQFFICVTNAGSLNGNYSAYGRVISGMNIADSIVLSPRDASDNPIQKIEMFVTRQADDTSHAAAPTLIQPADSAVNLTKSYFFKWNAVAGAQVYNVELSTDENFATILSTKMVSIAQTQLLDIVPGNRYYWRVSTNNGGFISEPSETRTFTSTPLTGVGNTTNENISVYPNPANELINIDIPQISNEPFILQVFSSNGQLIQVENIQSGKSSVDITALTPGFYFYTLNNSKENYSGKLSVIR
jgi:peptidyl-prolyl cis-trans isomerase B (cyclophilin B)